MKTFKSIFIALVVALSFTANAQKTAFIDLDSLLSIMPEMIKAKTESADYYKQLEGTLTTMQKELNDKLAEYQANETKYTDLIKTTKQKELQDLNQRIQDFQVQAQTEFQKKNDELSRPINEKAKKAIEKIAKAKGYKLVLDSSLGVLLYTDPADDLFSAVKADLGIK